MADAVPTFRPEFVGALRAFARASETMKRNGYESPILVGGAAVELYSGSMINTGDFDVVTARQDAFEQALLAQGFSKPIGLGHTPLGWTHPELQFGFEVVSSTLHDGRADRDRVRLIEAGEDGIAAIISLEDMIADRMGQFASGSAPEMLHQARVLFALYPDADLDYLQRRIGEETLGDYGVDKLQG